MVIQGSEQESTTAGNDKTEPVAIDCRNGLINGNIIRSSRPRKSGYNEKFVKGSSVTIYVGPDQKIAVEVNIGYVYWSEEWQDNAFRQVLVQKRDKAADAVDRFLEEKTSFVRWVDMSFDGGKTWKGLVEVPAGSSILDVANFLVTPPKA